MTEKSVLRTVVLSIAAVALLGLPTQVMAASLASDTFPYADGGLVQPAGGNGGWYANSGATVGPVPVVGHTIEIRQQPAFNEDVSKPFPIQSATAKTYAYFTVKVAPGATILTGPAGPGTPQYFAHFRTGTGDSASAFRARIYVVTPAVANPNTYRLGVTVTSYNVATHQVTPFPADLNMGDTYPVMVAYDATAGSATLWVCATDTSPDPWDAESPSVPSTLAAAAGSRVAFFAFRQGTPADGTVQLTNIDNLGVGTTFDDAVNSPAVPSVSAWGMLILAFMLLVAGGFHAVRHRRILA